jgi:methyl-accepting chemotaxis protein
MVSKLLAHQSVGRKLGLGFGLIVCLLAVLGVTAINAASTIASTTLRVEEGAKSTQQAGKVRYVATQLRLQQWRLLGLKPSDRGTTLKTIDDLRAELQNELKSLETLSKGTGAAQYLSSLNEAVGIYSKQSDRINALLTAKKEAAATELMKSPMKESYDEGIIKSLDGLLGLNEKQAKEQVQTAVSTSDKSRNLILSATLFAIALSVLAGIGITRSIVPGIKALIEKLTLLKQWCLTDLENGIAAVANGDLTQRIHPRSTPLAVTSKDEIGVLASTFNEMLGKLQSTIKSFNDSMDGMNSLMVNLAGKARHVSVSGSTLREASAETAASAADIARSMKEVGEAVVETSKTSDEIAGAAEQLAMSAQNAASAMNTLRLGIDQVADSSMNQKSAAEMASEVASQGSIAVEQTIHSMSAIENQVSRSSLAVKELGEKQAQIQAIVSTIDDIAAQTNLLALNAAIEAARAGEQGRGFAVVADEVRKLAERSSEATKEIASLIDTVNQGVENAILAMEASAGEVTKGTSFSSEAQAALREILGAIGKVGTLAGANDALVLEMKWNAAKVEEAVSSVASISEETAAGAQEMNAGAEEMSAASQEVTAAVTQQTAKIEQVSKLSKDLNTLASDLQSLVGQFKFEDTGSQKPNLKIAA